MSLHQSVHLHAKNGCSIRHMSRQIRRRHRHPGTEHILAVSGIRRMAEVVAPTSHDAVEQLVGVDVGAVHDQPESTSSSVLIMPAAAILA